MIGETPDDVIEILEGAGHAVTRDQLVRWHRAGLIPRPQVKHLGQGRGSTSYYSPGTAAQVIALVTIQQGHRRLIDVGWLLWWEGYRVHEDPVRARLGKLAETWTKGFDTLRESSTREDALGSLGRARLPNRTLRWTRQRLGRDAFGPWLFRLLDGLQEGAAGASEADLTSLATILDAGDPPDLSSVAETLDVVSQVLVPSALMKASRAPLADLEAVRDRVKQLLMVVSTFGEITLKTQGRWTPRLGAQSVFMADALAEPDGQALILLAVWAMEAAGLAGGVPQIVDKVDAAELAGRQWAAINEIRAMLPGDERHLLRLKRLGKAHTDPNESERLRVDMLRIREQWGGEIDAIIQAHNVGGDHSAP